jgi:hypothetical protein
VERIATAAVLDFLEVAQRSRGAGACRRLARLMRELGWRPVKARGLNQRGLKAGSLIVTGSRWNASWDGARSRHAASSNGGCANKSGGTRATKQVRRYRDKVGRLHGIASCALPFVRLF